MNYYKILIANMSFHGKEPLTYGSADNLKIGTVVCVPLQNRLVNGIVVEQSSKPTFEAKSILETIEVGSIPVALLSLVKWLSSYYPGPLGITASMLLPNNINNKALAKAPENNKIRKTRQTTLPPLTKEQLGVIKQLDGLGNKSALLHGDTGSGKTRIYIDQAVKTMKRNRSVLVLTPEIGLTPQLMKSFSDNFPNQTILVHSKLTPAQKRNNWLRIITSDQPLVIIGPRSALFSPVSNLGLIIMDEAHDAAYKQEQSPHYQTSRVAAKLAQEHQAKFILGTATPNISDYYTFREKSLPIIRMSEPAIKNNHKTKTMIVDLKNRSDFTTSPWLSNTLISEVRSAIGRKAQSLIFLNRRGSARAVLCQDCGWQALCPRCDIALTYHQDEHKIICHSCGHKEFSPTSCPECKSTEIVFKVAGTKAIYQEIAKLFPQARIARFDSDNLVNERMDKSHESLISGEIDIVVGTQLLTKGLDLPKLAVVGVVTADTALSFPDYTADEITFQQLSQVIGRVGRGHMDGSVIIQTYYPENSIIKAAVTKNYSLFYAQQIIEREKFLFPPFCFILKLTCVRKSSSSAQKASYKLYHWITELPLSIQTSAPTPSFVEKHNNNYSWQIIIKSKKRTDLTTIVASLPVNCNFNIDPTNLL